jgi:hypothetical protein
MKIKIRFMPDGKTKVNWYEKEDEFCCGVAMYYWKPSNYYRACCWTGNRWLELSRGISIKSAILYKNNVYGMQGA